MNYTLTQMMTKLKKKLRDENDSKWTSSEKDECLQEALEDAALATVEVDTSLTAGVGTQAYDVPEGVDTIADVWIDQNGVISRVSPSDWEHKYGKLIFKPYPPVAGTMHLTVVKKLTNQDEIPEAFANLLLYLAEINAYEMILNKMVSGFLINDISMAELQAALAYLETKVRKERGKVGRVANRLVYNV